MLRNNTKTLKLILLFSYLIYAGFAHSSNYVWKANYGITDLYSTNDTYPTPDRACQAHIQYLYKMGTPKNLFKHIPPKYVADNNFQCLYQLSNGKIAEAPSNTWRLGTECLGFYDNLTGHCLPSEEDECQCDSYNVFGNAINPSTGNNAQHEVDFLFGNELIAERYYNSMDDKWRHAYSAELKIRDGAALLIKPDGKVSKFTFSGSRSNGQGAERGSLNQTDNGWLYTSKDNDKLYFSHDGVLTGTQANGRLRYNITRNNQKLIITDPYSRKELTIEQDNQRQPQKIYSGKTTITYEYNNRNLLSKVIKTTNGISSERSYLYEDNNNRSMLTKIIDENKKEAARFTYSDRKVSSVTYGGKITNTFSYTGNNTKIKNALGKYTSYQKAPINGVNRIVAIEGEPTLNCPTTYRTCDYDDRGLIKTRTDNKGNVTTFEHNEYGFETSRTEAAGTAEQRTTKTEWHPSLPLPTKIIEPGQTTTYQYDSEGRRISQTTIAN